MRALFILLYIFFLPRLIFAEHKGIDVLGLAMQDCDLFLDSLPKNTAIGVLEGTFGDPLPCLERLILAEKVSAIRVHLINGPCWRNKNCEEGEPKPTDKIALKNRAKKYQLLFERHKIPCFLSPILEHDIKDVAQLEDIFRLLKLEAPNCSLVQSVYKGNRIPGILNEYHGNNAKGEITSNDGESIFDLDSIDYADSGSIITFAWFPALNLRLVREIQFIPPKKRKIKAKAEEISHALRLIGKDS